MITLLIICIAFLGVWVMLVMWQVGYFKFLGRTLKVSGWRIRLSDGRESRETNQTQLSGSATGTQQQADELFERRSLLEKSRPLVRISLLFALCGVLILIALFALSVQLRSTLLLVVGVIIEFLLLIFTQARVSNRCLMKLVSTTHCPQCGNVPMRYIAESRDERRLLICTQCHIEWDLGPSE